MTVLELLFVLLLSGLCISMAASGLGNLHDHIAANSSIGQAMQVALLSRQRAATTHHPVVWCPDSGLGQCATEWKSNSGWMIFADMVRNGRFDGDDELVSRIAAIEGRGWLVWHGFTKGAALMWLPAGYGAYQNGTLTYCPRSGKARHVRQLVLSRTGRPRYKALTPEQRESVLKSLCR